MDIPSGALVSVLDEPLTGILADAVIATAPPEVEEGVIVISASPLFFVSAVPETGLKETRELAVEKVTTTPESGEPFSSRTVAVRGNV
jgi:hypothetical protein